uniref:Uncharacterized protein n=1 Tax=Sarcophilus harrisii TaxID=9305 RepID=A0A7N4NYA8_SARHA
PETLIKFPNTLSERDEDHHQHGKVVLDAFCVSLVSQTKTDEVTWGLLAIGWDVHSLVEESYFLITGGTIYDIIMEPPNIRLMTDEHEYPRLVDFLSYIVHRQHYGRICI